MKTLILCESVHHNNTAKVAAEIASVIGAEVLKPSEADVRTLEGYDLIGFGSGIFMGKMHKNLVVFVEKMPALNKKAFVFSTSGSGEYKYHDAMKKMLADKGLRVTGEFVCKGWDTVGPLKLVGGINKDRPNEGDLKSAREFAEKLKAN
ncbi:flavodoxin [Methanocella sp. CWC-04]|uniref:Flavodoxin n=1 Tax=Methanooceanicella nereidis TaxID=2052831 RepID=A0AAP2W409_9EURY|nr:flavodoxin family protein [Methanocella sp. CWC-04]MCD1293730.1 flavodoxin [Methanocella sp. CWC-04]